VNLAHWLLDELRLSEREVLRVLRRTGLPGSRRATTPTVTARRRLRLLVPTRKRTARPWSKCAQPCSRIATSTGRSNALRVVPRKLAAPRPAVARLPGAID
jgi:hypothetical protein